jgi:hypothetical protein
MIALMISNCEKLRDPPPSIVGVGVRLIISSEEEIPTETSNDEMA